MQPDANLAIPGRHINADSIQLPGTHQVARVPGLTITNDFLSPLDQARCVEHIDAAQDQWRNDLRRRVQHYGWRYDYRARAITPDMYLGQLPQWLQDIAQRIYDETGLFDRIPEQVIVNEYLPGQGIGTHIDHPGFGPAIATVSLLDDWEMDFSPNWRDQSPALLTQGSAAFFTGPARNRWQHGIPARRHEPSPNGQRRRSRRISLTFRTVRNRDNPND